jgi:hypothetical protein
MTIQPQSLQKWCPLDNDQLRPDGRKTPSYLSNVGSLKTLPLEVVQLILNLLDLQCLTDFRAVSWSARALVDSVPKYNALIQHCPDALRALLSTRMAVYFSASQIFEALCTQDCAGCGLFGPFLDLFTARRYCITCVGNLDELLSMTAPSARKEFNLDLKTLRKIPTLLSIPGKYTEGEKKYRKRISLVRMLSASVAQSQREFNSVRNRPRPPPTRAPPQPSQAHSHPVSHQLLQQFDGHMEDPYRFMSMLRIPFLDRRTGDLDWGVSCQACRLGPRDKRRGYCNWNNLYSTSGYIEHFQKCELSQRGRAEIPKRPDPVNRDDRIWYPPLPAFFANFKF